MSTTGLRAAVGSDTVHPLPDLIIAQLKANGCQVVRCGAAAGTDTPWPDVAEQVARLVAQGAADFGVLCCWTGTGVSIAANKVPGIRAALCADAEAARGARLWNDANVLALALQSTSPETAAQICDIWLQEREVDPEEAGNIRRLSELEARYGSAPHSKP